MSLGATVMLTSLAFLGVSLVFGFIGAAQNR